MNTAISDNVIDTSAFDRRQRNVIQYWTPAWSGVSARLAYALNEDGGLRCLYHGWKFDVEGNILEMASEPDGAALKGALRQKSYPVREAGGFVWAWLGPKGTGAAARRAHGTISPADFELGPPPHPL